MKHHVAVFGHTLFCTSPLGSMAVELDILD